MTTKRQTEHSDQDHPNNAFDSKDYLLSRYGLYMNKEELCFEKKMSRASIDNRRNPKHPKFDPRLAAAEASRPANVTGSKVLFRTVAIAELMDSFF